MAKQAAVKAAAVKADVAAVAAVAPVAYVLTAEQTADVAKLAVSFFALTDAADNVKVDAYDILSDLKTVEEVNAVRDAFKAEYAKGYDSRFANADKEKRTNACNMAWSRVCAYAKEKGWDKPVAENAKAKAAREARAAESKGKVDGRTAKAKGKVEGVVVAKVATAHDDLDEAMQLIRDNATLRAAFDVWFAKAQAAAAALAALAA
jgi:uncharacterized protein YajQ (UPF0234 family)